MDDDKKMMILFSTLLFILLLNTESKRSEAGKTEIIELLNDIFNTFHWHKKQTYDKKVYVSFISF